MCKSGRVIDQARAGHHQFDGHGVGLACLIEAVYGGNHVARKIKVPELALVCSESQRAMSYGMQPKARVDTGKSKPATIAVVPHALIPMFIRRLHRDLDQFITHLPVSITIHVHTWIIRHVLYRGRRGLGPREGRAVAVSLAKVRKQAGSGQSEPEFEHHDSPGFIKDRSCSHDSFGDRQRYQFAANSRAIHPISQHDGTTNAVMSQHDSQIAHQWIATHRMFSVTVFTGDYDGRIRHSQPP